MSVCVTAAQTDFFENCVQNIRKSIAISVQMVYNNIKCCFLHTDERWLFKNDGRDH